MEWQDYQRAYKLKSLACNNWVENNASRLPYGKEKRCLCQWPRGLRRRSTAARLLRLWVRIPPGAWMSVRCECCVWSLWRADHAARGVLSTVMRRCVWSRNLKNEEAMARVGPQRRMGGGKKRWRSADGTFFIIITLQMYVSWHRDVSWRRNRLDTCWVSEMTGSIIHLSDTQPSSPPPISRNFPVASFTYFWINNTVGWNDAAFSYGD